MKAKGRIGKKDFKLEAYERISTEWVEIGFFSTLFYILCLSYEHPMEVLLDKLHITDAQIKFLLRLWNSNENSKERR